MGFDTILERGRRTADELPDELVYAGFSLGVMPAQLLAQTRPGAHGALFITPSSRRTRARSEVVRRPSSALEDRVEAHFLRVADAFVEVVERVAVVQVGGVNDVPVGPQVVREREHAGSQPLGVVKSRISAMTRS